MCSRIAFVALTLKYFDIFLVYKHLSNEEPVCLKDRVVQKLSLHETLHDIKEICSAQWTRRKYSI